MGWVTIIEFSAFLAQMGKCIEPEECDELIYYFYNETAPIFLLTVYGKSVQEDLTQDQKAQLTKLAKALKAECKAARIG